MSNQLQQSKSIKENDANRYNEDIKSIISKNPNNFSDITVVIQNVQGYPNKKPYVGNLMRKLKPTFCTLSELKMREPDAECLEDDYVNNSKS